MATRTINAGLTAGGHTGSVNLLLDPSRIAGYGLTATEQLAKALDDISITDLGDVIIFGVAYLLIMRSSSRSSIPSSRRFTSRDQRSS